MALTPADDLRYLKGVGEARMKLYTRLGLQTVEELLYHLPRGYLDLRHPLSPGEAPLGELCPVRAVVVRKGGEQRLRKGLSVFKVQCVADEGAPLQAADLPLDITFYNAKYTVAGLQVGQSYLFYGRVGGSLLRREMQSPAVHPVTQTGLLPVYPATAGLTSRMIATNVATALEQLGSLPESLPPHLLAQYTLPDLTDALRQLHHPTSSAALEEARRRLVFEELLTLALGLSIMRQGRQTVQVAPMEGQDMDPFYAGLPFTPTQGQRDAIADCCRDMCSGRPMNRLVQGDVGSGKTLVAAAACYFAARNGLASAMMAPTELLAQQHHRTLTALLAPHGLRVGLLTGSMTAGQKKLVKQQLATGELELCVGTHALLSQDAVWQRLGLVITDEQHRFGVAQRMSLTQKGRETHTLVMSATPIPRTLGLILYGDMELSLIKELPRGRQPIDTFLIDPAKRERAFGYLRQHLDRGLQGYLVCPLVEEDEELPSPKKAAVQWLAQLQETAFAGYRLGLLHGKMKQKEKDTVMAAFAAGQLQLLVATTVIEVGIDVPNAAIMLIEDAESFGLSQLHQLRGRVGRGTEKSSCILVSETKNPETLGRLKILCKTTDGFALAEYDLETRGPGDFFGLRQHGIPTLRVASLTGDSALLEETRTLAQQLLEADPTLDTLPQIRHRVEKMVTAASVL